jgi:acyl-coenzyme A thioesterase PaaI-like protein
MSASASAARLLRLWRRLSPLPGGAWLFSRMLGWTVPYSGTLGARVVTLEPGHARLVMRERRGLRNHLHSIHALALANLGELTSGLATTAAFPTGVRGIVTALSVEYLKKARGTIAAECTCAPPEVTSAVDHEVHTLLTDRAGDTVARVTVRWRLAPERG